MMRLFASALWILAVANPTQGADPADRYVVPLVGPYAVYAGGRSQEQERDGVFRLVEWSPGSSSYSSTTVEPDVRRIAVRKNIIAGESAKGHFILDVTRVPSAVEHFDSLPAWLAALGDANVSLADADLVAPSVLAANMSDAALRPWRYRLLGGALGLSDDMWSLVLQIVGFCIAFLIGLLRNPLRSFGLTVVVLGLVTNVIAQIFIAGGGPGAFVGFFVIPLYCWIAAWLGRFLRLGLGYFRPAKPAQIAPAQEPI
jgi:hypothetical protein